MLGRDYLERESTDSNGFQTDLGREGAVENPRGPASAPSQGDREDRHEDRHDAAETGQVGFWTGIWC